MNTIKTFLLAILFLPFILIYDTVKSSRSKLRKTGYILAVLLLFSGQWFGLYRGTNAMVSNILYNLGIIDTLTQVHVTGTSMLPTIKDGDVVSLHSPKKFGIGRGDKISFQNEETNGLHYLKRIVGFPGERISIQNGMVIINGQALSEPYVLNDLPTYGNSFLLDCEEKTIPNDQYFVMGDNRTVSSDSRVIGFVAGSDIDGVIKAEKIPSFSSVKSTKRSLVNKLDTGLFFNMLNKQRLQEGEFPLVTHEKLKSLAQERAKQIAGNIASWKTSSEPIETLLDKNGYEYNLVDEFVAFGYYNEQEILEQILDSGIHRNSFLSREMTEIGVGVSTLINGSCNIPVIVAIVSWPSVPTYDQSVIDKWSKDITALNQLLDNMRSLMTESTVDKDAVREIITKIAEAHVVATRIHAKMTKRQQLTAQDYRDIELYKTQINSINEKLDEQFGSVQGVSTIDEGRLL